MSWIVRKSCGTVCGDKKGDFQEWLKLKNKYTLSNHWKDL